MPDTYPPDVRSRVMAQIKARGTRPELALRSALRRAALTGWRGHGKHLPGNPDVYFPRAKVAVFVDGAFWHGHPRKYKAGQSGEYWDRKITRNMERDRAANRALRRAGWRVVRVWDFDLMREPSKATRRIVRALEERR